MTPLELCVESAKIADQNKASNIIVQDLKGLSDICNYQTVCSASNTTQTKAIARYIEDLLRTQFATKPISIEGRDAGSWILLDYGGAIVHIFEKSIRDYYAIDQLWPKANKIKFQ